METVFWGVVALLLVALAGPLVYVPSCHYPAAWSLYLNHSALLISLGSSRDFREFNSKTRQAPSTARASLNVEF